MAPMSAKKRSALDHFKAAVLGDLHTRLSAGTPVVLADYDVIFLRNPQIFCEPLEKMTS